MQFCPFGLPVVVNVSLEFRHLQKGDLSHLPMTGYGKSQKLEGILSIAALCLFVVVVAGWDSSLRQADQATIHRHAKVIEDDLWDLNSDASLNYLALATDTGNYEQLNVFTADDELLLHLEGSDPGFVDLLLLKLGLIPKINLQADVYHNDSSIGRIEAVHRHDTVYRYLYFFLVILLVLLSVRFFIRLLYAKETLETRVQGRTAELAEEKERLAVTLRSIGDGVITTDLQGKVVLINKISEMLTGWSQEEAAGKPIEDVFNIINEQTGKPCENPVEKVLATGQIIALANHTALIAKDGTRHVIEDSGAPIFDQKSNIIGTVLVYRDVTSEKRTKTELAKIQKLESVGVLAGGIAHDFNNILAAILGNVELAAMYTDPDAKSYPLLEASKKAALRAKGLTRQLLTFARGGDPVRQSASIKKIVTDSANFVLHGSSVVCDYHFPEDLWNVDVDTGQISQVIQNIIINGCHAMPDGGVIEVFCKNVEKPGKEVSALSAGKYIKITISDSGSGIPAKFLDKIFDPYFSTKQEGSGLGLAICYSIISKHDGMITATSDLNRGTDFTIYLPACVQTAAQDQSTVEQGLDRSETRGTILIMDDEEMIRDMTSEMLSRLGHEVLLAEHGHEAIEIYNEHRRKNRKIDIIIMDLTIPGGMGGKDTIKEILRIDPQAKVVVASGYSNDPVMARYRQYGFRASIAKPFQIAELNTLINDLLQ